MADSKLAASPTRTSLVALEAARTDPRAPTLVLKTMKRLFGSLVDPKYLTKEGCWKATTRNGRHCFVFSDNDPKPAYYAQDGDKTWRNGVAAALGKLGLVIKSGKQLLEEGEITEDEFNNLASSNKTTKQFWLKTGGEWKPKTKWTPNMVTYVNKRGKTDTFEKKLYAKAPSVMRGSPSKTKTTPGKKTSAPDPVQPFRGGHVQGDAMHFFAPGKKKRGGHAAALAKVLATGGNKRSWPAVVIPRRRKKTKTTPQ